MKIPLLTKTLLSLIISAPAAAQSTNTFRGIQYLDMQFTDPNNWRMNQGDTVAFYGPKMIFKGKGCEGGATPVGDGGTYIITEVGPYPGRRDVWKTGDMRLALDETNMMLLLDEYKTHHVHYFMLKNLSSM